MAEFTDRYDTIVRRLREAELKLTPQRLAITKILAKSEGHPSVERIYQQLQDAFPTMSLATVYRNIMLIKSLGEVLELGFPDGSNRYDGNKPYPHPHVVCIRCKTIIDPDLASLQDMTAEVAKETGFEILNHRLDFFGVCPNCRKRAD
ncbi:MAG: transcriptional repressor [Desulfobacterales bacterium]|nr:transcriptional repressor [Desulfobacterales bacterium]